MQTKDQPPTADRASNEPDCRQTSNVRTGSTSIISSEQTPSEIATETRQLTHKHR